MPFDSSDYAFASPQVALPVDPVLTHLVSARALIAHSSQWCKGAYGFHTDGPFCAVGALFSKKHARFTSEAYRLLNDLTPCKITQVFNDHPGTTHADILALYDRAIAARRAEIGT